MLAIWTNGVAKPFPSEFVILYLCKDVYHCMPSQLDDEDGVRILQHLDMLNIQERAKLKPSKQGFTG